MTKILKPRSPATDVALRIHQVFGADVEVVDATEPLRLQPISVDCEGADPKAPDNCILVHTAHRMFGSRAALFWKRFAYVDLISPDDGIVRVNRFLLTDHATRHVMDLDGGKPFREGTAVILRPPTKSVTLVHKRKYGKRWRNTNSGQLSLRANAARVALKKATAEYDRAVTEFETVSETAKPGSPKITGVREQRKVARTALTAARATVDDLEGKLDQIRKAPGVSRARRKTRRFDLTTRNGASGQYNFIHNGE